MAEPRLVAELPVNRHVRIPKDAGRELAARFRNRADAERRLNDFLAGVALAKGVRLEDVTGFDDETCSLLVQTTD